VLVLRPNAPPPSPPLVAGGAPGDTGGALCLVGSVALGEEEEEEAAAVEADEGSLDEFRSEAAVAWAAVAPEEGAAAADVEAVPPVVPDKAAALVEVLLEVESLVDCTGASAAATGAAAGFAGN